MNTRINASLITTVFNDENGIKIFLKSLKNQSIKPQEIIIVDAGSRDNTQEIIKKFIDKNLSLNLKFFVKKGNRSVGRNKGICKARNNVIAVTDVGCILDRNWFKKITEPFKDETIDIVAGFYKPVIENTFQKCLASYTCIMKNKITDDFLPSSRSIAFRKNKWKEVGGYPENLNTCEDLFYAKKLKDKNYKFFVEKNALVFWPQRKNLKDAFIQFYKYSLGDGKANYFRKSTPILFLRALFFLVLLIESFKNITFLYILIILILFYIIWSIVKNYRYVKNKQAFLYLPLLQITSDIAVFLGTSIGYLQSLKHK